MTDLKQSLKEFEETVSEVKWPKEMGRHFTDFR